MKFRTKRIEIAVSKKEYEALQARKTKPRLAEWIRETCLNELPKKTPLTVDPLLLYELNKIGVNLNQIAKKINQSENNIEWLIELKTIENHLNNLLKTGND